MLQPLEPGNSNVIPYPESRKTLEISEIIFSIRAFSLTFLEGIDRIPHNPFKLEFLVLLKDFLKSKSKGWPAYKSKFIVTVFLLSIFFKFSRS
jgi:hypothetical protein